MMPLRYLMQSVGVVENPGRKCLPGKERLRTRRPISSPEGHFFAGVFHNPGIPPITMTYFHLIHLPSNRRVAQVTRADNWLAKGWGVLGRPSLPPGEGFWLPGVASVHTIGVRFALDLLFLDDKLHTLRVDSTVMPGRPLVGLPGAAHTLELGAGTLAALQLPVKTGDGWRLERA